MLKLLLGSANWFLLLEVLLLNVGALGAGNSGNSVLKNFCFIKIGPKIRK